LAQGSHRKQTASAVGPIVCSFFAFDFRVDILTALQIGAVATSSGVGGYHHG